MTGPDARGTGRTTKQMQEASRAAVYVWIEGASMSYVRALAVHLGRTDLQIVRPPDLQNVQRLALNWGSSEIVIDHAARLTTEQHARVSNLKMMFSGPSGRLSPGGMDPTEAAELALRNAGTPV